jgi:hypothetical protein
MLLLNASVVMAQTLKYMPSVNEPGLFAVVTVKTVK